MVSERKRTIILCLYLLTLSQETTKVFIVYTALEKFGFPSRKMNNLEKVVSLLIISE